MDILTDITWEYMQEKIDKMLEGKPDIVILDWALLPISKYWKMCDIKILAVSEQNERKKRVMERDRITEDYFEQRETKSLDYKDLEFDYILDNDYNKEKIEEFVGIVAKKWYYSQP